MKRFSIGIIVIWTAMALANSNNGPVSASDQQIQAKDLAAKRGQQQVDLFTGSFGYSIPIACAPARNGSEPNLALAYSSKGENDWCGMGWKLDIGYIERNSKDGFPIKYSTSTPPPWPLPLSQYDDSKGFVLNLFGKELKLLPTATANEYRPEVDTDFLRCILDTSNNKWTVYDKSGNVYYFGQTGSSRVVNPKSNWGTTYMATFHWGLDQIDTPTGDRTTVTYQTYTANYDGTFSGQPEETIYPTQITYNNNYLAGSFNNTHTISFTTSPRTTAGTGTTDWHFSYRWGFRTEQTRLLTSIVCQVNGQNVCRYQLSYIPSRATGRSLLHSVTVNGSDNTKALPVQTFTYQANPNGVSFGSTIQWSGLNLNTPGTSSGSYEPFVTQVKQFTGGFNYSAADLVDIDGDGLPDRVCYDSSTQPNQYQVQKNLGVANGNGSFGSRYAFGPSSTATSGMTPTQAQTASDANPIPDGTGSAALNTPYGRIRDINGDGLPDRVIDGWKPYSNITPTPPYTNFAVMLNTGNGFSGATATLWAVTNVVGSPNDPNGANWPYSDVEGEGGVVQAGIETFISVGLFDINGDGLPDRIMTTFPRYEAMTNLYVQFNTGTNFTQMRRFPYKSQNMNGSISGQVYSTMSRFAGIETIEAHMVDINGDGLPDHLVWPVDPNTSNYEVSHPTSYYAVEYDDGYSFEAINTSTTVPGAADQWAGVITQANNGTQHYIYNDFITFWSDAIWDLPFCGLYDLNGDGLPDRVVVDQTTLGTSNIAWFVYLNNGHGFNTAPIRVTNIENQSHYSLSLDEPWWSMQATGFGSTDSGSVLTTLMDVNGDGLLDRVMVPYNNVANPNSSPWFLVQLNQGPYPDLLTNIDNGIGGTIGISYKPSTTCDNRTDPTDLNSGSRMPFPQYVAAAVTESDGVNPMRTTSYDYAGGFYDGVRREFHGFAVVTNTDPTLRKTITYFHTGGGRNYASLGEYQDVNATGAGNFAKAGMAYRIETYGNDSPTPLLYKVVVNQVDQVDSSYVNGSISYNRYFPFISQTFEYDYPGGGTPRITGSKFVYTPIATDTKIYDLTQKILWGEVSSGNLSTFVGFNDTVPADTQYYQYSYASIGYSTPWGTFYISDHPLTVSLTSDLAGNNVIQQKQYTYNTPSGTTLTEQTRICSGTYAVKTYKNYNSYGLPTLITDPVGVVTEINYDSSYNIYPATTRIRVTPSADSANDLITTTSYDVRSGPLTQSIDPMGVTVNNTYDPFFRLTESDKTPYQTSPFMKKVSYNLGVISSGTAVSYEDVKINDGVDPNNGVESRTYFDGFGRPIQMRTQGENVNYRVISTAYDARGEAFLTTWPRFEGSISFSKPTAQPASFTGYDAAGRVNLTRRRVDASFDGNGAFTSKSDNGGDSDSALAAQQWSYVNGTDPWWKVCTNEDNKVRRYQLDAFGRNKVIQEVSGGRTYATTTLSYDLAGNLAQINNQNNENIYYGYDDAGNKLAMADPYLGQWTYQRDSAGRIRVQTDARGDAVAYSYINPSTSQQDPLGRVQQKNVYNSVAAYNSSTPASTATYTYDVNNTDNGTYPVYKGLLYMVTDSEGWEKNGYDTRGRLKITTRHLNVNNQNYTTTYSYNDGDKVTSMVYPNSGPTVNYSYWTGGSIKQVANNLSFNGNAYYSVGAGNYDEFGHVTSFAYGNNVTTTRNYTHYANSRRLYSISSSPFSRTYAYSAGDDILAISGTGMSSTSITYDDLHRILTYTGLSGSYSYDPVGSIQQNIEAGGPAYNYGSARKQAVKGAFGYNYYYDLCGNMIVRHGGTTGSQAMAYDAENRLTVFSQVGAAVEVAEFGYAGDGTRLWKRVNQDPTLVQVWIGNIYEEKGGKTLFHVFAGDQQVCTFESGSPLAGGSDSTKVGYYYHEDNLNSSSALSDRNGSQQEVDVYYPFGRTVTGTLQASFQVSRKFTGQVYDQETGLYYYNARYYDPELGRFIQPDTEIPDLGNPQSYNRYSYVLNNPLRYTDPTGHWGQEVADWWSGTVGSGANYISASPSHWIYNGTVGTVNSLVGGLAAPLGLGSSAGSVSGNPNARAKDYAIATVTEAANAAAIIPVTAAGGKAVSTLVRAGEREAAGELAGAAVHRVITPGKAQFQLRSGEQGLSVFDASKVSPQDILPNFREGSQVTTKTMQEIESHGLSVERTPGNPNLPQHLQEAHMEIRPGANMERPQFKQAIKKLEPPSQ